LEKEKNAAEEEAARVKAAKARHEQEEEKAPDGEGVTIDIEAIKKGGFPTQEEGDAFRKWVHADAERLKKVDAAIAAKGFADDNLDLTGGFNNEYIIAALELVGDEYATFKR
jgi:hypothetical protein